MFWISLLSILPGIFLGPFLLPIGAVWLCFAALDSRTPVERRWRGKRVALLWIVTLLPGSLVTCLFLRQWRLAFLTGSWPYPFDSMTTTGTNLDALYSFLNGFIERFYTPLVGFSFLLWLTLLFGTRNRISTRHRAALTTTYGAMWSLFWVNVALVPYL